MRILSIDFDYFVDATMEERVMCFPDGNDNLSEQMTQYLWERRYSFHDNLKDIGVIKDYDKMCEFFKDLNYGRVLFADSHREIQHLFSEIKSDEELELINVDFHHDMYITGGDNLDCGNWLRFLLDLKPNTKVTWVRREDSDLDSLSGEFPHYHTTDITEVQGDFDLVFVCFSSPWTPPHLFNDFLKMCGNLRNVDMF